MGDQGLIEQILNTWQVLNRINLHLLQHIHAKGFGAVPLASRGRNVAQQFAHMHKVRIGWLQHNDAELVAGIPRFQKGVSPEQGGA